MITSLGTLLLVARWYVLDPPAGQLGFKLESTRGPVDVLVIDSVQPPTEN